MNDSQPIFVLGNPRSGTTLLRLMLCCHRNLVIAPEGGFAVWLLDQYGDKDSEYFLKNAESISERIFQCKKVPTWGVSPSEIANTIVTDQPKSWSEVVAIVYQLYAQRIGKPDARWGDKNNFYIHHVPEIRQMFPDAKFIHIARDPRYVAASYRRLNRSGISGPLAPSLPDGAAEIANQWCQNIQSILNSLAPLPMHSSTLVRYEDLTSDPQSSLESLCQFLSEPFDSEMLEFHKQTSKLEPKETMPWKAKTMKPASPPENEAYQDVISSDEAAEIMDICDAVLKQLGYAPLS